MAFHPANPSTSLRVYLDQWLKVATDGNVSYEDALLTDRIKFFCKKCGATQACERPKSELAIDYVVKEFVNLHAHRPGHTKLDPVGDGMHLKGAKIEEQQKAIKDAVLQKQEALNKMQESCGHSGGVVSSGNAAICTKCQKTWPLKFTPSPFKPSPFNAPFKPLDGNLNMYPGKVVEFQPSDWPVVSGMTPYIKYIPNPNAIGGNVLQFPTPVTQPPPPPEQPKALRPKTGRRFR